MFQIAVKKKTMVQLGAFAAITSILLLIDAMRIDVDWLLGILACMGFFRLLYNYPNFVIRYIMIFFMAIGNLVGVMICEHSKLWLTEMGITSFYCGSFPLLLAGWFLLIVTVWMLDVRYNQGKDWTNRPIINLSLAGHPASLKALAIVFLAFISVILFLSVAPHPAFLENMDRFTFAQKYLTDNWKRAAGWVFSGSPILIAALFNYKRESKSLILLASIGLTFFCLYLFYIGEKFGGFWSLIVNLCIVFSIYGQKMDVKRLRQRVFSLGKIFLILFMVLVVHLMITHSWGPSQVFTNYLPQRTAQQGQLWWRTYSIDRNHDTRFNELSDETRTYFQFSDKNEKDYNHAIYKIMRFTVPADIFNRRINNGNGSRYSTSTFASIFYYFKRIGVIIYPIIAGLVFWLFMKMFLYSVSHFYVLEMILSAKILGVSYGALAMSEFNLLFQFKPMIWIGVFCGLVLFRKYLARARCKHWSAYESRK